MQDLGWECRGDARAKTGFRLEGVTGETFSSHQRAKPDSPGGAPSRHQGHVFVVEIRWRKGELRVWGGRRGRGWVSGSFAEDAGMTCQSRRCSREHTLLNARA